MAFAPGDIVHVPGLGTGVLREERGGGRRYAIEIKGRLVVANAVDVERATPDGRTRKTPAPATRRDAQSPSRGALPRSASSREAGVVPARSSTVAPSLDLHGTTTLEALEALESFLNEALLGGHAEARIIHGRSGGRLKAVVHQYLRRMATVAAFRVAPGNPGLTIVTFS